MAKLHVPQDDLGEEGWKTLEPELTRFFAEFSHENGLELRTNPDPPYHSPVFLREAYDPQTNIHFYLTLILGKAPEHDMKLEFMNPIPTRKAVEACVSLGIENCVLNGRHYDRKDGKFVNNSWNQKTGRYEEFPLKDTKISQVGFSAQDYDFERIETISNYVSSLLKIARA